MDGINCRLEILRENISALKNIAIQTTQSEMEKRLKKKVPQ